MFDCPDYPMAPTKQRGAPSIVCLDFEVCAWSHSRNALTWLKLYLYLACNRTCSVFVQSLGDVWSLRARSPVSLGVVSPIVAHDSLTFQVS